MSTQKKLTDDEIMARLELRLGLIARVPSASNLVIAFEIADALIMSRYEAGSLDATERDLERYEKLRSLALGTKNIPERRVAFERAVTKFRQMVAMPASSV